jgi:uncharacterized protein (TIGR04141 family)
MPQVFNIYRIDKEHRLLRNANTEEVIEKIINTSLQKNRIKTHFTSDQLKTTVRDNVNYYLYLYNTNEIESDWHNFLPSDLTEDENFTQQKLSLILFSEVDHHLFCVIGGNAYQIIVPFIDHSFGLNTYSRIMNPELDELASIRSRGITGARAGLSEQFRDDYKIIDFIKFGKVPQEIHLTLSSEISNLHFGFLKNKVKDRIQISVGKGFKIKKEIDFEKLQTIVIELSTISELEPSDFLSSYKEITDHDYIEETLRPELITKLYQDSFLVKSIHADTNNRFEFDFCNPNNIEKFYEADEYRLKEKTEKGHVTFKKITDRREIYNEVMTRAVDKFGADRFNFMVYLQGVWINCYQNKKPTIKSTFLYHISAEFNINNNPIFLVDTKWYHLRNSFVLDLKTSAQHVLRTYPAPIKTLKAWNKEIIKTEKEYNLLYSNNSEFIVIDTIIADGLELCDLLHYDGNQLFLIHIKYGFNAKMRELTNQITISARRLKEIVGTNEKKIFENIYGQLIEKNRNINGLTLEDFKNLFRNKISYILAFSSHLSSDLRVEDNIDKFDSNIARFSLIQCSSEMWSNYYPMYTHQIERN